MVGHVYNLSFQEAQVADGLGLRVHYQPGQHSKTPSKNIHINTNVFSFIFVKLRHNQSFNEIPQPIKLFESNPRIKDVCIKCVWVYKLENKNASGQKMYLKIHLYSDKRRE